MNKYDVCIIGSGPVGLFAGFYAGMRNMSVCLIDQLETPGGQLAAIYPEKFIYDVPGFSEVRAGELIDNLLDQLKRFESTTTFELKQTVESVTKNADNSFTIKTNTQEIMAGSIIIAGGNGGFKARELGIDGEANLTNLHYFVKNMNQFADREIAIFGGGDSAVDWALMLEPIAKKVHIIHRRDEFRAHDHSVELLKKSKVEMHMAYNLDQSETSDQKITSITLKNKAGETTTITPDDVICNFGFVSNLGAIKDWGLNIDVNKIVVDSTCATNIPGIFAIGDICTYPGKSPLITVGFGEGPIAINSAWQYLNPDAKLGVLHSTSVVGGGH